MNAYISVKPPATAHAGSRIWNQDNFRTFQIDRKVNRNTNIHNKEIVFSRIGAYGQLINHKEYLTQRQASRDTLNSRYDCGKCWVLKTRK